MGNIDVNSSRTSLERFTAEVTEVIRVVELTLKYDPKTQRTEES